MQRLPANLINVSVWNVYAVTHPALALERLTVRTSGEVVYELKQPFSNGITHFVFSPVEFMAKLAALVPRPRANLTRYHGVLAPNSKHRKVIVPTPDRTRRKHKKHTAQAPLNHPTTDLPTAPLSWTERFKRVFNIDIENCPRCGAHLRVIATITQPDVIKKILDHVHLQQAPPKPARTDRHQRRQERFDVSS